MLTSRYPMKLFLVHVQVKISRDLFEKQKYE